MTGYYVIARSVADYRACGVSIPETHKRVTCHSCGKELAVGPTGQLRLQIPGAKAFCDACGLLACASMRVAAHEESPEAKAQRARSETARETRKLFDEAIRAGNRKRRW